MTSVIEPHCNCNCPGVVQADRADIVDSVLVDDPCWDEVWHRTLWHLCQTCIGLQAVPSGHEKPTFSSNYQTESERSVITDLTLVETSSLILLLFPYIAINIALFSVINVKNFHGSLATVVRAQNDTPKTANITCRAYHFRQNTGIALTSDGVLKIGQIRRSVSC